MAFIQKRLFGLNLCFVMWKNKPLNATIYITLYNLFKPTNELACCQRVTRDCGTESRVRN